MKLQNNERSESHPERKGRSPTKKDNMRADFSIATIKIKDSRKYHQNAERK